MLIILHRLPGIYIEKPRSKWDIWMENRRVKKSVKKALKKPLPKYKVLARGWDEIDKLHLERNKNDI